MNSQVALTALLLVLVLAAGIWLMANQATVDIAGPLRDWLWERDARRMRAQGRFPSTLERSYWTEREYRRDAERLRRMGYVASSEQASDPFVVLPYASGRRPPPRRRVPVFHVVYRRDVEPPDA
jgi:hypothetical protein